MPKTRIWLGTIVVMMHTGSAASDPAEIDFFWSHKQAAAHRLFASKKYAEAQRELEALVATAPTEAEKADVLSVAARALAHQERMHEAMTLAETIDDAATADYTSMEVMAIGGRYAELVERFKTTDLTDWPDPLAWRGYLCRGNAHDKSANAREAARDWENAVAIPGMAPVSLQLETLNRIGAAYVGLDDREAALAAYRKALAIIARGGRRAGAGSLHHRNAVRETARLLAELNHPQEARAVLAAVTPATFSGWAGIAFLYDSGDVLALIGDTSAALKRYREGLEWARQRPDDRNRRWHTKRLEKRIAELQP